MPRSIWNGTLSFGLIAVPIKVHSAIEDHGIHFHQVHEPDGAQIRQKRMCSKEHREVPYSEVVKGYQVDEDEYVVLTKDEIAAAAGERAHVIELEEFVALAEVDPSFLNRAYHLGSGEAGQDAYRLLHDALEKSGRMGIGRWVFHNREYLVAVRARDGALALHTMRFADELVGAGELELPEASRSPDDREIEMATKLVDSLHEKFAPEQFQDNFRERLRELIATKARGEEPTPAPAEEPAESSDLLAALEASLSGSRG